MTSNTKPGHYVAICNKADFSGLFIKVFEYPQSFIDDWLRKAEMIELGVREAPNAEWYFLNRIDLRAVLDAVYPLELFEPLQRGGEA